MHGSRSLWGEDGSLKTALSIFPDCRTSFISDVVCTSIHDVTLLWLYSLVLANGLFLYYIFNRNSSLWTDSRIWKGPIYSQLVLRTKKPHAKQKKVIKNLPRPVLAMFAKVGIWKHKTNASCHPTRVAYLTWSCSSLKVSLVLTWKLLSLASS